VRRAFEYLNWFGRLSDTIISRSAFADAGRRECVDAPRSEHAPKSDLRMAMAAGFMCATARE